MYHPLWVLGQKEKEKLTDKYYRKTYRSQQEMFSDSEDVDYMTLYIYNIMPEQIKKRLLHIQKHVRNQRQI